MKLLHSRWVRIAAGIAAPLVFLGGFFYLYRYGSPFVCTFHAFTGLYCPGCGAGRALFSLVHGDFGAALRYNAFFLLAFPLVAYYLAKQYIRFVFHRDPLPFFHVTLSTYNRVMLAIVAFWILRNIPCVPFTFLAP